MVLERELRLTDGRTLRAYDSGGPTGDEALAVGFEPAQISAPVLLVQGGQDRVVPPAHADWLLRHCPTSELWLRPNDGHICILDASPLALDWLREHSAASVS